MSEVAEENQAEEAQLPAELPNLYRQLFHQCNSYPVASLLDIAKDHSKQANKEIRKPSGNRDP